MKVVYAVIGEWPWAAYRKYPAPAFRPVQDRDKRTAAKSKFEKPFVLKWFIIGTTHCNTPFSASYTRINLGDMVGSRVGKGKPEQRKE